MKVQQVAENLRAGIAALTFAWDEINASATVSIGCSISADNASTDQLIKQADLALYQAKCKRSESYGAVLDIGMFKRPECIIFDS
jgi:PleD family two-component response regulator